MSNERFSSWRWTRFDNIFFLHTLWNVCAFDAMCVFKNATHTKHHCTTALQIVYRTIECTIAETLIEIKKVQYRSGNINNGIVIGMILRQSPFNAWLLLSLLRTKYYYFLFCWLWFYLRLSFKKKKEKWCQQQWKQRLNNQSVFDVNRYFETISKLFKQNKKQ